MLREKSKRSLQVYGLLRSVREMLGLQGFLLCVLALTPKKIQSMTKADAINFSYILKRWWEDSWPSFKRLKIIAETLKTVDEQIPYIPLTHKMDDIKCCVLISPRWLDRIDSQQIRNHLLLVKYLRKTKTLHLRDKIRVQTVYKIGLTPWVWC